MPELTVATLNGGGGARNLQNSPENNSVRRLVGEISKYQPDVIALQEAIRVFGRGIDTLQAFRNEFMKEGIEYYPFFLPLIDKDIHWHPKKWRNKKFAEYEKCKIQQGLALLVRCDRLGGQNNISIIDPWVKQSTVLEDPKPLTMILSKNDFYAGGRDTEDRGAAGVRLSVGQKNLLVVTTHLSTLTEEDIKEGAENGSRKIRRPTQDAIELRQNEVFNIVGCIKRYQKRVKIEDEPVVLLGDFNCEPDAEELKGLEDFGLVHAQLKNKGNWKNSSGWTEAPAEIHSHRTRYNANSRYNSAKEELAVRMFMDQVHYSARTLSGKATRIKVKSARIINLDLLDNKGENGMISDHNPVVITLEL